MREFALIIIFYTVIGNLTLMAGDPEKKAGTALRIEQKPVIDGVLNESFWSGVPVLTDFTQLEPNPGIPASRFTEVKIAYDNDAIYIAAFLKESSPDSILRELTQRDEIGNADWFGFFVDAYKDGNNGLGFIITASGVQVDIKYSVFGEDESWNAVWQSAVKVTSDGWYAEMKIPYSALRFPNQNEQQWHVNLIRYMRNTREKSTWNKIDPMVNGFLNQSGYLNGIQGIEPPVRLQLSPYVSTYYNVQGKNQATSINGGMDVKYGLSDAFTLDMTLIPDFGQVQSDNQVLNLSPFEVRFQENRQFFTEGTELFNKGDLFYSRRVGETNYFLKLNEGEEIKEKVSETRLLNATKISGRTRSGLGVGVFNALTKNNYVEVGVPEGSSRKALLEPLTNFNVFVLDQNLKNNSYVTLINTSVLRSGEVYDANVSGTEFYLQNKNLKYFIGGGAALSQQYGLGGSDVFGNKHGLRLGKGSGNFTGTLGYNVVDDQFNPNDLGFQLFNNFMEYYASGRYDLFKPFGKFNRAGFSAFVRHSSLYKPREFNNLGAGIESFFILKTFHAFGVFFNTEPITTYDFFEPRSADYSRFYTYPINHNIGGFISTDYRKKFAFDINMNYRFFSEEGRNRFNFDISPRFRVNNHLSFIYTLNRQDWHNDVGYAVLNNLGQQASFNGDLGIPEGDIIFGIRDQKTYTNILSTKYTFNNKMGLTFRLRHYWSKVLYDDVYRLDEAGRLAETAYTGRDVNNSSYHDNSFNAFNIDMVYSWVFSPGSELRLVWKNSIFGFEDRPRQRFDDNLNYVFDQPQTNSFSMKFLYFIDYSTVKPRRKA